MTDLYDELCLPRGGGTADIRRVLAKQRDDWTTRFVALPTAIAARTLALIGEAERAFATDENRTAYDEGLARGKVPGAEPDQDAARRKSYERFYRAAKECFERREYDLAEAAIAQALENPPAGGADYRLCALASDTCFWLDKYAQSFDYLNQAIVIDPENARLYLVKYAIAYWLSLTDPENRHGMTDQLVGTLRTAIKKAEASADRWAKAEAESHLAKLLFARRRGRAEAEAIRLAQDALDADASLEGARWVIKTIVEEGWIPLVRESENNRTLYIKKDIVAKMPYHQRTEDITWEGCTLRGYLNNEYYNSLPAYLRSHIVEATNQNPDNPEWGIPGGRPTCDKVFLLSIDEVKRYFSSDSERVARFRGADCCWWLRSPGYYTEFAAYVDADGSVTPTGDDIDYGINGIRPALWLNL